MDQEDADRELVARCRDGDRAAFAGLVERYQRPVYNAALRLLGDREEARDVAQSAFLKVLENLDRYDPRFKFFSWIYRIAVNEALHVLEKRRPTVDIDDQVLEAGHDPAAEVGSGEVAAGIQGCLLQLSADHRAVVVLRHFSELSYEEIATVLELPAKTVKSRLFEARERLRGLLEARGLGA